MFAWWGRQVVRLRGVVLAAGAALFLVGAAWGTGVFGSLTGGGFSDPGSESTVAYERIAAELGSQDVDLVVLYSSPTATADAPGFAGPVTAALDAARRSPAVSAVVSWYDARAPGLISTDRHATYATVRLTGTDEDGKVGAYEEVLPLLRASGVATEVGGWVAFLAQSNEQTERDVARAELLSAPVLLVLLVLIFRGLVAAATPLLIGGLAILGAFTAVRLLTYATDVSIFAINIITVVGLGMAIDYALFVVSRFREELGAGHPTPEAIGRTLATAGRTVMVSGLTIMVALGGLLIFPQVFLRSMAWGGMAAVGVAMLASLTVLPALLAVLGGRINTLRVPLPRRRRAAAGDPVPDRAGAWARLARSVMRRPVWYAVGVTAVLLVLATPALRMEFGGFDERVLPAGAGARVVAERVAAEFPGGVDPIAVLVSGAPAADARAYAGYLSALPGATGAEVTAQRDGSTLIAVGYPGEPTGAAAEGLVRTIRDLPGPAGAEVLVAGRTAADLDLVDSLRAGLPWMALLMATTIMVLLFLAFGSVLLPLKAVLMNVISIGASFGVVVWVFQDGHLTDLLGVTTTGFIQPAMPVLMFAVLFGLSTDYEVFLLSRVREEWDRTGDNTGAVAIGLQRTGGIITAAALLLIVVVGGFAAGGMSFVKLMGVGMIVAIVVDATLVRALLVPATMRLLGRWNWWAPGPLAKVYRRYGIHESDPGAEVTRQDHLTLGGTVVPARPEGAVPPNCDDLELGRPERQWGAA
jgi:RND superfamily putative drug exporter